MDSLLSQAIETFALACERARIKEPEGSGAPFSAPRVIDRALFLASSILKEPQDQHHLVIVSDHNDAMILHQALYPILGNRTVLLEPWDALPFEPSSLDPAAAGSRTEVLAALCGDPQTRQIVCVASARSVARKTLNAECLQNLVKTISYAEEISPGELRKHLAASGYHAVTEVAEPGEFAHRGGVLDLFTAGLAHPVRVEWDDDLIESIRIFDVQSQLTIETVDKVTILPPREITIPHDVDRLSEATEKIRQAIPESLRRDYFLEEIESENLIEGVELFLPFMIEVAPVWELGRPQITVVDPERTADRLKELFESAIADSSDSDLGYDASLMWLDSIEPELINRTITTLPQDDTYQVGSEPLPLAPMDASIIRTDLKRLVDRDDTIVIFTSLRSQVKDIMRREKLDQEKILILDGDLDEGALYPGGMKGLEGLAVISDSDLFGKRRLRTRGGKKKKSISWGSLSSGEHVVHVQHGVGIFRGIEKIEALGEFRDVIAIEYADGDKLYLPPYETALIERYPVAEGRTVRLDRLGSASWAKVRKRVESDALELGRELLDLYAIRSSVEGTSFMASDEEDRFADSFGYDLTPDQATTVADIYADLEKQNGQQPMDRLVCGDVGFGKTEVALRATFRVVQQGKQVAVLCPTTILALQHTQTFRERLTPFGIRVGTLSRFEKGKAQKQTLEELGDGRLSVVIGTHKLLSKSTKFRNLGLIVIDEEQRFGVRAKEFLKNLRKQSDVLTMTATPIPRTLNLALSGVRNVSLIETAPPGRTPVQTIVEPYNEDHIRRAIRRELDRDGQVFFVHNRIATLERVYEYLTGLFPNVTIEIGHGQMKEDELSDVMHNFIEGNTQILLSTSIVENGLDIPRANTIIVDRAEWFGLSDLYQLRGRVGRSKIRAYSYFFYSSDTELKSVARERLAAIAEHTSLGSGYAVARRDMEIRGAGAILGKSQSGEMEAVGYDMYCRLLRQAIKELKGESEVEWPQAIVDFAITAFVPGEWLGGQDLISDVHRQITQANSVADVDTLRERLIDRFGHPPESVENLLDLARIRNYARQDGIESIIESQDGIEIRWRKKIPKDIAAQLDMLPPTVYAAWTGNRVLLLDHMPKGRPKLEILRRLLRR